MTNENQFNAEEPRTHSNEAPAPLFNADIFCDAGNRGCAEGPIEEIAMYMRDLEPGQTLELHATHASVLADLGPWTRLVGHEIIKQEGDHYLLRRGG